MPRETRTPIRISTSYSGNKILRRPSAKMKSHTSQLGVDPLFEFFRPIEETSLHSGSRLKNAVPIVHFKRLDGCVDVVL